MGVHAGGTGRERPPLPAPVVATAALAIAGVYAVITPLHWRLVSEENAHLISAVAAVTVFGLLWAWWVGRTGRVKNLRRFTLLVAAAPIVNCLVHIAATGSTDETPQLMLFIVAIGAALTSAFDAGALILAAMLGWGLVVATRVDSNPQHTATQLGLAGLTAATLHLMHRRSERVLSDARDALAMEVQASAEVAAALAVEVRASDAASAALAESEQRFREVFSRSPVGLALSDENGRFVTVNNALLRLLDRTEHEVLGHSSEPFTHPDDVDPPGASEGVLTRRQRLPGGVEKRYVRPDGSVRWAWLTVTDTPGPQGQRWTLAHVQDVTERRLAEQLIADSERNLAAVTRVTHRIQAGEDVRSTIVAAAKQLADAGGVVLVEPDGDALVVTSSTEPDLEGVRLPYGHTSGVGETYRRGTSIFVADMDSSPLVSPLLREATGAQSALFQPVSWQGSTVAILAVHWAHTVETVSERVCGALALLADEMAVAFSQEAMRAELQASARTDELTGLPNRREWDVRLGAVLANARRSGEPVVVALADLDRFKQLNDACGHAAGDAHLQAFAHDARQSLREVDVLARWGGEEFAIAMPGCADEVAEIVLTRVRATVPGEQTVSIGWATWDGTEGPDELLHRVDEALYAAKAAGRDRVMPAA